MVPLLLEKDLYHLDNGATLIPVSNSHIVKSTAKHTSHTENFQCVCFVWFHPSTLSLSLRNTDSLLPKAAAAAIAASAQKRERESIREGG